MEPLADDHSSDSDDAPTGVEESAAPAAPAVAKTRRPTSSSYGMLGGHLLAASATTQNVVATSSGEAEFYALTKSASRALGAVAMAADMVKVVKPRVRVDATASKAIASRRGVGRVRDISIPKSRGCKKRWYGES